MYGRQKGEKTVQMPDYCLILERSTVEYVDSIYDEATDIIELDVADKALFFKRKMFKIDVPIGIM